MVFFDYHISLEHTEELLLRKLSYVDESGRLTTDHLSLATEATYVNP